MEIEKLYFFDALIYFKKLKRDGEQKQKEKLMEYATLTQIIHTGEPKKLIDKLNNILNDVDEDLGYIDKLSKLKKKARR